MCEGTKGLLLTSKGLISILILVAEPSQGAENEIAKRNYNIAPKSASWPIYGTYKHVSDHPIVPPQPPEIEGMSSAPC